MPPLSPADTAKPVSTLFENPRQSAGFRSFVRGVFGGLISNRLAVEERPAEAPHLPAPKGRQFSPEASSHRSTAASVADAYFEKLRRVWQAQDWTLVDVLFRKLRICWSENRQVFLCGNGGSAANAIHLANDLLYGVDKSRGYGLRVTALPANASILTCLANDISYDEVFAQQLRVLARSGDLLIAFSGSGNSPNIVKALLQAREIGMTTFAVLGFTGGLALKVADHPIYFPVHDMQAAEDLQMMVGHMAMQWLGRSGRIATSDPTE